MLQFIFGRAASGKTHEILNRLEAAVKQGKETILFVPEQFSFETERAVLKLLGDRLASKVSVMSFNRLCDEIERLKGGVCAKSLTDYGKLIILNRALKECAPQLEIWKRYISYSGFTSAMLDSIEEFKLNAITPDDLKNAALNISSQRLLAKLHDMVLIYSTYNALVAERYIDPSDRLTLLYDRLANYDYFKGKMVFFDSFKSFTGQQYRILKRIFASAEDVVISFTNEVNHFRKNDTFENIRKAVNTINNIAASYGVKRGEDIVLCNNFYTHNSLKAAEEILYFGKTDIVCEDSMVNICSAQTVYDEAEFVARTIRRLVRTENYRFRDFVIIARDTSVYEEAVLTSCEKNGVACFMDKRLPLSDFPPVSALMCAFEAARTFSTEHILRFHKSGLSILSVDELSLLENYIRLWDISGKKWLVDWDMNPNGLDAEENTALEEQLEVINGLRRRAVMPLWSFSKDFNGTAAQRTQAIIQLFDSCNAADSFLNMFNALKEQGEHGKADALKRSWEIMTEILDSLTEVYGEYTVEHAEFCNSFKVAARLATIGVTPQMLDEVTFGAADRIRPSRPKIAFILGANQGVFPCVSGVNGLLGISDREELKQFIDIPDRTVSAALDEEFLIYTNLCCATERLYISYFATDTEYNAAEPSRFVSDLREKMLCNEFCEPDTLNELNLPETEDSAFSGACVRYSADSSAAKTLFAAISDNEEYNLRAQKIESLLSEGSNSITPETAKRLYGNNISISATRFDTFHRCKFQFFCRYGLRAKKLQPAQFDVLQRGTLIHYVLQRIFEDYSERISELTDEEISAAIDGYIEEYLSKIPGYRTNATAHLNFITENMARSLKEVAAHLRDEFAQSQFKPQDCELQFGINGKEPVTVDFDGGKILLNGSVDRVDTWNGYIRIVDYKSGSRSFRLPDILVGQNLQMLLYLYALTRGGIYDELNPAGIFYMPSRRDKKEEGLAMNGLMVADEELVHAMDRENAGEFVPCLKLTKSGTINKNNAASFVEDGDFEFIFDYIERLLRRAGRDILNGDITVNPKDGLDSAACKYCDFAAVCAIGDTAVPKAEKLTNSEVMERIKGGEENGV